MPRRHTPPGFVSSNVRLVHSARTLCVRPTFLLLLGLAPTFATPLALAGPASHPTRRLGAPGMPEPHTGSLLVEYYESYLRDHDIDTFRQQVSARYLEGTLARLLDSSDPQTRRAAVLGLGLFGSFAVNAAVAKALKDPDPTVRALSDNALWAIWFRADTPENNAALEKVGGLVSQQRFEEAIEQATRLVDRAPKFAEAYNQRAIARFFLGRFQESAEDCQLVLTNNPYHFGALAGLARCQIQLGRLGAAVETLKRAAKLQPYNRDISEQIAALESGEP